MSSVDRVKSYGQDYQPTAVDKFGVWLSARAIHAAVPDFSGLRIGDFGCGYNASFVRSVLPKISSAVLVDVGLAPELVRNPKVNGIIGRLPQALEAIPDGQLDVVMCMSVIEHLADPLGALTHFKRLCAPGGVILLNVPTWRGKWFLEFAAFRLGVAPADEMNDHKMYYDPRDLWPLLVRAGIRPQNIKIFTHKFGLNCFAICRNF